MFLALLFFSDDRKSFLCPALLVSIGHSHSISRHRPRNPSQKFNMCDLIASSQDFVAKVGIACEHWCPYIVRHRAPLCVLLTHAWKPGFREKSEASFVPLNAVRIVVVSLVEDLTVCHLIVFCMVIDTLTVVWVRLDFYHSISPLLSSHFFALG